MTTTNLTDIVNLVIVILVILLIYRTINQPINIIEGYASNNMPEFYGNLTPHNKISYSGDSNSNIAVIHLTHKIRLESLVLDLEVDESATERTMALIHHKEVKDDSDLGDNHIVDDQGNMMHQLVENKNGNMRIKIYDIKTANSDKPVTDVVSITLNGGEQFKVKNVWVYGMDQNAATRKTIPADSQSITASEKTSASDPNSSNSEIYSYIFPTPVRVNIVSFDISLEDSYESRNPPQLEVHYKSLDDGNYKVNTPLYLSNMNLNTTPLITQNIYLPNTIVVKELYLKVPSSIVTGISGEHIIGKELNTDKFTNTSRPKKKETFASGGYAADDMCPSLEAMEDKIKLTDQICSRLEYNDKIKNERIKLERTKQYISKLKEQDGEIKKLENVIKSLQGKRNERDSYDDALRLAQYDKQRKHVAVVQDLAQKRDKLRNNNVVNVQLNLKNKQVAQPTETPS